MASSYNSATLDEHNVHINLCPQNKICFPHFSGKSHFIKCVEISSGVFQPGRPARDCMATLGDEIFSSSRESPRGIVYMHNHHGKDRECPYGRNCVNLHFLPPPQLSAAVWGAVREDFEWKFFANLGRFEERCLANTKSVSQISKWLFHIPHLQLWSNYETQTAW